MSEQNEGAIYIPLPEEEKVNVPLYPLELSLVGPWVEVARVQAMLEQLDSRFRTAAAIKYGSVGNVNEGLVFFLWRLADEVSADDLLGGGSVPSYQIALHDPDKMLSEGARIVKDRAIQAHRKRVEQRKAQVQAGQKVLFPDEPLRARRNTPQRKERKRRNE